MLHTLEGGLKRAVLCSRRRGRYSGSQRHTAQVWSRARFEQLIGAPTRRVAVEGTVDIDGAVRPTHEAVEEALEVVEGLDGRQAEQRPPVLVGKALVVGILHGGM